MNDKTAKAGKDAPNGTVKGFEPDYATPPGWISDEWIGDANLTDEGFAELSEIDVGLLGRLLTGEAEVTVEIAGRLEATDVANTIWLQMEQVYQANLNRLGLDRKNEPGKRFADYDLPAKAAVGQ